MRTDFYPIPRMDREKRVLRFSISILFLLFVVAPCATLYGQPSCISRVNVTLDDDGEAQISPGMFSRDASAGWTARILDPTLSDPTIANCTHVGRDIMVEVTDTAGHICMSMLNVEDKSLFEVEVRDTLVSCAVDMDSLQDLIITLRDNCDDISAFDISYTDNILAFNGQAADTLAHYLRIWSFINANGQSRTVTSNIYLTGIDTALIMVPMDTTVYCPNDPENEELTGELTYEGRPLSEVQMPCGVRLTNTITRDVPFKFCNTKVGYTRRWILMDSQFDSILWMGTQAITYEDSTAQRLEAPEIPIVDLGNCQYSIEVQMADINEDGCTEIPDELLRVYINDSLHLPGDVLTFDYGDTAYIRYEGIDDCWEELSPTYDTLTYRGVDTFSISCPVAIGSVNISVDPSVGKEVWAMALLNPTVLTCGRVDTFNIVARRMTLDACDLDTTYRKVIPFCAADIGSTVMVQVAAMNNRGSLSSNTCMVPVSIKSSVVTASIICPPDTVHIIDTLTNDVSINVTDILSGITYVDGVMRLDGVGTSDSSGFTFTALYDGEELDTLYGMYSDSATLVEDDLLIFECSDTGTYALTLTLTDTFGRVGTCDYMMTIADTMAACSMTSPLISMSVIGYEHAPMSEVSVEISDGLTTKMLMTDEHGSLSYFHHGDVLARLSYPDMMRTGLTVFDILLLKRYILGTLDEVESYHPLTADMDGSGSVDLRDVVKMRKLLLGLLPDRSSDDEWVFMSENDVHGIASHILRAGGDHTIVAAKRGDMDGSSLHAESRSADRVALRIAVDAPGADGWQHIRLDLSDGGLDLAAFQGTLNVRDVEEVRSASLGLELSTSDEGIHLLVDDPEYLHDGMEFFVRSTEQLGLDDISMLDDGTYLPSRVYTSDGVSRRLMLSRSIDRGDTDLLLYPNPSNGEAKIYRIENTGTGDEPTEYSIRIVDMMGRQIYQDAGHGAVNDVLPWSVPTDLPRGIYLISCDIGTDNQVFKYFKN